jgi:hypothetical protein
MFKDHVEVPGLDKEKSKLDDLINQMRYFKDFIKKLNRMDVTSNRSQHQIKNGDIVLTYLGMLCMGKPYFEAFSLSSENFAEKARMTGLKWQSSIAGM